MSTAKVVTILHPSASTPNIVNDASGNVAVGNNLTVAGTTALTGNVTAGGTVAMGSSFKRNRIINGNMLIDQRNAGASQTTSTTNTYMVDRWYNSNSQNTKWTAQQNAGAVTPPVGFTAYQGATSTSAYSLLTGDFFFIAQAIEGLNILDLAWGTANAKTVTLSFQVYSSLTGTFGGSLRNSAANRSYPFSYAVASANTWTPVSITIAGDTSGTWLTTNGIGILLSLGLGVGSTYSGTAGAWAGVNYASSTGAVSVVGTSGATFYITGVQLEVGTKATPYEMQIYSDQLAQCQRYLPAFSGNNWFYGATPSSATIGYAMLSFPVTARVPPTGVVVNNPANFTLGNLVVFNGTVSSIAFNSAGLQSALVNPTCNSGLSTTLYATMWGNSSSLIYLTGCEL